MWTCTIACEQTKRLMWTRIFLSGRNVNELKVMCSVPKIKLKMWSTHFSKKNVVHYHTDVNVTPQMGMALVAATSQKPEVISDSGATQPTFGVKARAHY